MSYYGYTKSRPIDLDISRQLQRGQQLKLQRDAFEQRNIDRELSRAGKLEYGWAAHNPAIQKAWSENTRTYGKAVRTGDTKSANEALLRFDELRYIAKSSTEQGRDVAMWKRASSNNPNKFTIEGRQNFRDWERGESDRWSTDGNGKILYEGEEWDKDGRNPFLSTPEIPTASRSFNEIFRKQYNDKNSFMHSSDGMYSFNDDSFNASFEVAKQAAMNEGVPEEEVESQRDALSKYYNRGRKPIYKPSSPNTKSRGYTYNGFTFGSSLDRWERIMVDNFIETEPIDGVRDIKLDNQGRKFSFAAEDEWGEAVELKGIVTSLVADKNGIKYINVLEEGTNESGDNVWKPARYDGEKANQIINQAYGTRWKPIVEQLNWGTSVPKKDAPEESVDWSKEKDSSKLPVDVWMERFKTLDVGETMTGGDGIVYVKNKNGKAVPEKD